jgi:hypothetical protein
MAELPNRTLAFVSRAKLLNYLLSMAHPSGRHKARVLKALGFDESNADDLERGLLAIAATGRVVETETTPHGMKYVVEGELVGSPSGSATMRTVWVIEPDENRPRLVTAYPAPRRNPS